MPTTFTRRTKLVLSALLLPVLLLSLATEPALAQRQITFNEAVNIALEQNNQIRQAQNQIDLQDYRILQSRANLYMPNLSAGASAGRSWGISQDPTTFQIRNTVSESANFSANTGITLFNGFANVQNVKASQATQDQLEYNFARTQQSVINSVIVDYLNYMLAEENIGIQEENLAAQNRQLEQIQEFVNVGQRPRSDLYSQEASVANAEAQLLTAQLAFENAKTALIRDLQLDPLNEYDFVAPNLSELSLMPTDYNAEQMLRTAFEKRPDLMASESAIEVANHNLKAARGGRLPSLSMSAGISSGWSSRSDLSFQDQLQNSRGENVGFRLSVPLFNRFQTKTQIESSKVQYENARYQLETARLNVATEIRQAYINYENYSKQLEVTEKQLRSAEQALEVEQSRYDLGSSTLVELTQARAQYVSAQSQRAQAILRFHFQQRSIEFQQGTLTPGQPLFSN